MPNDIIPFKPPEKTYSAKQVKIVTDDGIIFTISGTLDGFVDFCIEKKNRLPVTCNVAPNIALHLIAGLHTVIDDIKANCLYDKDALLKK